MAIILHAEEERIMQSGIGIFVMYRKKILLPLRDNNPLIVYPNTYSLVGGGPEGIESAWETAVREWHEEFRYRKAVTENDLRFIGHSKKLNKTYFYLELQYDIDELLEGQGYKYFSLEELLELDRRPARADAPGLGGTMKTIFLAYPEALDEMMNHGQLDKMRQLPIFKT